MRKIIPKFIPARNLINNNQKIPKKIFQTWSKNELSKEMYDSVMTILNRNQEYDYYFYDDNDCRKFIEDNFSEQVLQAYDNLVPGAYKADLWRACILYVHGGAYFDCKAILNYPIKTFLKPNVSCLLCTDLFQDNIYNAIVMSVPKNNYLLEIIKSITETSLNGKYLPEWEDEKARTLAPTGRISLG